MRADFIKTKMVIFCTIFLFFCQLFHRADSIFPIDNIRVRFTFPSTVTADTPIMAWFLMEIALKVIAVGIWLGLPRIPERRPLREVDQSELNLLDLQVLNRSELVSYLDVLAQLDNQECLSRLICHLQALPKSELSFESKVILRSIWISSWPSLNYSPIKSPRRNFVNAAHFGKITGCSKCCQRIYKSCPVETTLLLEGLDFL